MQLTRRRLFAVLGFEVITLGAIASVIHFVSTRNNGLVWSTTAAGAYWHLVSIGFPVVSLTTALLPFVAKISKNKTTRLKSLSQMLKACNEWLDASRGNTPVQMVWDAPDPGMLDNFVEHRKLLWRIRRMSARDQQISYILVGEPAPLSRANPLARIEEFEFYKRSKQFKQFRTYEKCPADPSTAEYHQVLRRYMQRVLKEFEDWELDGWDLSPEKAREVDTFFLRVGNNAVFVRFDQDGKPKIYQTCDPHVIDRLNTLFKELQRFSKKRAKGTRPRDDDAVNVG